MQKRSSSIIKRMRVLLQNWSLLLLNRSLSRILLVHRILPAFFIVLSCGSAGHCQAPGDTIRLSLPEVVAMAKEKSIASRQAVTVKETKYWQWRTFKSNYQPQLAVSGILPYYSKT